MFITRQKWRPSKTSIAISNATTNPLLIRCSLAYRLCTRDASARHTDVQIRKFSLGKVASRKASSQYSASKHGHDKGASFRPQALDIYDKVCLALEKELRETRPYDGLKISAAQFWDTFHEYQTELKAAITQAVRKPGMPYKKTHEGTLNRIFTGQLDERKVAQAIKIGFYNIVMKHLFTSAELRSQKEMIDCRYPMEWFPHARLLRRTLHLHVGPTNSGKTYQALKKLEAAKVGCYAGPLRLLAQEIYARMNSAGKPTWLVTGDDQQAPTIPFSPGSRETTTSCTVEMIDFQRQYDVAVIDEVQMAADKQRGHAWTAAIVGVPAREVHMCGEDRTVPLIQEIARSLGEELVIHRYERLSPLAVMDKPLPNMSSLMKGDCIVCFSVMRIHAMKRHIERLTGRRVAIVYGSLPPEVRAQQARLFNDQDNDFDFLVASDAIGMGLNLAINRVIFDTTVKRMKSGAVKLSTPEIRQIGGRAGRYAVTNLNDKIVVTPEDAEIDTTSSSEDIGGTLYPAPPVPSPPKQERKPGLVTAFERSDLVAIGRAISTDPESILKFGVLPTNDMIELFCSYFPVEIPYSFILARMLEISQVSSRYFLCDIKETITLADIVQPVTNLSIAERIKMCFAPASPSVPGHVELIRELAEAVANQSGGDFLDIKAWNLEVLDETPTSDRGYLERLEILHKGIVVYLWMSFRFPGVFIQRPLAIKTKMLVEEKIDACLNSMKYASVEPSRLQQKKTTFDSKVLLLDIRQDETDDAETGDPKSLPAVVESRELEGESNIPADDSGQYLSLEEDLDAETKVPIAVINLAANPEASRSVQDTRST